MPSRFVPSAALLALVLASGPLAGCGADASDATATTPPVTNAACFGPDGTSQRYTISQDAYGDLKGVWDRCESTLKDVPPDTVGIDFDGKFAYFLVPGPNGTSVRSTSDAYVRAVQVRLEPAGIVLVLSANDGTFSAYSASITTTPHRLRLENTTTHAFMTLGARTP